MCLLWLNTFLLMDFVVSIRLSTTPHSQAAAFALKSCAKTFRIAATSADAGGASSRTVAPPTNRARHSASNDPAMDAPACSNAPRVARVSPERRRRPRRRCLRRQSSLVFFARRRRAIVGVPCAGACTPDRRTRGGERVRRRGRRRRRVSGGRRPVTRCAGARRRRRRRLAVPLSGWVARSEVGPRVGPRPPPGVAPRGRGGCG